MTGNGKDDDDDDGDCVRREDAEVAARICGARSRKVVTTAR
jgi:hypothetical protein